MTKSADFLLTTLVLALAWACGGTGWAADRDPGGVPPAAPWPQWRGPTRDGQVHCDPWPDSLQGKNLEQLWRVELGPSYSGPIVSADKVFTTETRNATDEVVRAIDRQTGKQLWQVSWKGSLSVPFFAKSNGDWIRSTPALDGDSLYVAGIRDLLVCLDAGSGAERWRVDFVERFKSPLPAFGFVSSPLVTAEAVYVQAGSGFVKLDKATGATRWRVLEDEGGMQGSAFASPFLAEIGGRLQILVQTRTKLAGVDPDDGTLLWSQEIPAFRGMNILTPTVFQGGVLTSSYGGKTILVRPAVQPDKPEISIVTEWTSKLQGYMSSPIVIDGHAYLHLRNQRFTCVDLADGTVRWTTTPFGKYWSLVANRDRILALDERGLLYLLRANPERYEQLDSRQISQAETWAHVAVAGDELFVRELHALAAYRWRRPEAVP